MMTTLSHLSIRTDNLLTHLSRVLATSQGVEASLCTLCYSLTLLHALLTRAVSKQYEHLALQLATKTSLLGVTTVTTLPPPQTRLRSTASSIKALADLIEDFRIFTRLWGLVNIYTWARETYLKPPRDPTIKILVWAEVGTSIIFQFLENTAYLASKNVLRGETWARRETKWMAWSNRFWMAQVLLEGLRLLRVRQLRFKEDFGAQSKVKDAGQDEKAVKIASAELKERWKRDFWANAGWFPLTLHWSYEDVEHSPVSETVFGLAGLVPGIVGFKQVWADTA